MSDPIVLVHGIFGFDRLGLPGFVLADYFRGVPGLLRERGFTVPPPPALNPAGSIAQRANDLKNYLETHPEVAGKRVHIIAHSMGGLDSRYMISRLGMANRVITLTTISTPHHGSPIADMVVGASLPGADQFLQRIGINVAGIADLTTLACADFNTNTPEMDQVKYFSFAGWFTPPLLPGILGFAHQQIFQREGANDGMVSVRSAKCGKSEERWNCFGQINANHFRVINWGENLVPTFAEDADFSVKQIYLNIATHVVALPPA